MTFKPSIYKAKRYNTKASIQIEGLTGSGKTGLALIIAQILANDDWARVGLIDTENRSSNLYEGNKMSTGVTCGEFIKMDLNAVDGYAPVNYIAGTQALIESGAEVVIADSISHAWQREGGVLDMVNKLESTGIAGGKFRAWGDPEVVKNKNALFTMLRNDKVHMITTVRVKEKFAMVQGEKGQTVVSLGEQQQAQDGIKYEPDLVLHMISPGSRDKHPVASVIKSRYPMIEKDMEYEFTPEFIKDMKAYLEEGADPEELLERQKLEYMDGIMEYCKAPKIGKSRMIIYKNLKQQAGFNDTALADMPVQAIKSIYIDLTQ